MCFVLLNTDDIPPVHVCKSSASSVTKLEQLQSLRGEANPTLQRTVKPGSLVPSDALIAEALSLLISL